MREIGPLDGGSQGVPVRMLHIDVEPAIRPAHAPEHLHRTTHQRVDRQRNDDLTNRFGACRIVGGTWKYSMRTWRKSCLMYSDSTTWAR